MLKNKKFKVACVQMNSQNNMKSNILYASDKIYFASKKGAKIVILPENAMYMNKNQRDFKVSCYTEKEHPGVNEMKKIALKLKIWILIGSVNIKEKKKIFNRSILIGNDGKIKKRYDKIHLFSARLPNKKIYNEKKYFNSGKSISLFNLPWGKIGMTICYDLRFPYLYNKLALKGALFISVPSAFTQFTGKLHWHILLRARAIETGCYIFAPAQNGTHPGKKKTFGHSLIINPWGEILCDGKNKNSVLIKEINPSIVFKARQAIPSLKNIKML